VEGAHLGTGRDDETKYGVHVAKNIARCNADDSEALTSEDRIASGVSLRSVTERMALAIDFNEEAGFQAREIHCHLADGKLAAELQPCGSLAEHLPQQHFRQAHLTPQLTCALYLLDRCLEVAWAPSTMLRMVPLPVPGRIW